MSINIDKFLSNFNKSPLDDLYSTQDEVSRRKVRMWIGVGILILGVPVIPAIVGGVNEFFLTIEKNKKVEEDARKITEYELNQTDPLLDQASIWQARQERTNDDLKSEIESIKQSINTSNQNVVSELSNISKQIEASKSIKGNVDTTNTRRNNLNNPEPQFKFNNPNDWNSKENNKKEAPQKENTVTYEQNSNNVTDQKQTLPKPLGGNLILPQAAKITNFDQIKQNTQQFNSNTQYGNTYSNGALNNFNYKKEYWPNGSNMSTSTISTLKKKPIDAQGELVIPMGAAKGILLTGGTLKTLESGKSEPQSVFIKLDDDFVSSNKTKLSLKGCIAQGAAKGDFGTGTTEIRISSLQCTAKDKKGQEYLASTENLKAWVFDESNLYGIESRVVSKEGEIFAKSIPLAMLNTGLSMLSTLAQNTAVKNTTEDGTVSTTVPVVRTVSSETDNIMNRIADLWLKYLDSLSPVVQYKAGRKVTVAFSSITKLKWEKVEFFQADKPLGKTKKDKYAQNL